MEALKDLNIIRYKRANAWQIKKQKNNIKKMPWGVWEINEKYLHLI